MIILSDLDATFTGHRSHKLPSKYIIIIMRYSRLVWRGIPIQYNIVWYHAQQSLDYRSLIVLVMCIARIKLHTFCQYALTNLDR